MVFARCCLPSARYGIPSELVASALTSLNAKQAADTAPGIPTDPQSQGLHYKALDAAIMQALNAEPVDVAPITRGMNTIPRPVDPAKVEGVTEALDEATHFDDEVPRSYTEGIAPRLPGEDDKAYAKRVIDQSPAPQPQHLPDEPARYFDDTSNLLPIESLVSTKSPEENAKGGTNGLKRFAAANDGVRGKREPISVHDNGDGTFSVLDGNGTLTAARAAAFKQIPARIFSATVPDNPALQARYAAAAAQYPGYQKAMRELAANVGGKFIDLGLKSVSRTLAKVNGEYGGVVSEVKDLMRGTLVIPDHADAGATIGQLRAKYGEPIKLKNSLDPSKPLPFANGYRDINSVWSINGEPAEVQINLPEMLAAKEKAHPYYAEQQDIDRAVQRENRRKTPEESARYDELDRKQAAIYLPAWDAAMARLKAASETMSASSRNRDADTNRGVAPDQSRASNVVPSSNDQGLPPTNPNLVPGGNLSGSTMAHTSNEILTQKQPEDDAKLLPNKPGGTLMQNRDRARAASLTQMAGIANAPEWAKVETRAASVRAVGVMLVRLCLPAGKAGNRPAAGSLHARRHALASRLACVVPSASR